MLVRLLDLFELTIAMVDGFVNDGVGPGAKLQVRMDRHVIDRSGAEIGSVTLLVPMRSKLALVQESRPGSQI